MKREIDLVQIFNMLVFLFLNIMAIMTFHFSEKFTKSLEIGGSLLH